MTRLIASGVAALLSIAALRSAPRPAVPLPLPGTVVIHGGGVLTDDTIKAFIGRAGGAEGRLVLIPTAAEKVDEQALIARWSKYGIGDVAVLHTRSREEADTLGFSRALDTATAVWIGGGQQTRLEAAYVGTRTARALAAVLDRGGVVGGSSAGAAALSRVMIRKGKPEAEIGAGLGLLQGVIVDQHFTERGRGERLEGAVAAHPGTVGYGVDENTALVISGREMRVAGPGGVHILLGAPASGWREARHNHMRRGMRGDHVAWRRAALARTGADYPPAIFPDCELPGGATLVLVGGGSMPRRALEAFVRAAGGKAARIAVINTALGTPPPKTAADLGAFDKVGATNLRLLHAGDRAAAGEEKFIAEIDGAGGLWFTGGRQWRLVDRYLDTPFEDALRRLLARGGAVGGTSAGATICGDYLVRGDPLGNHTVMAEGYERGLALLPGVAIDQHFTQRNRLSDLVSLKRRFPQLLAIGLDETTAAIVSGSTMRVAGIGKVTVMSEHLPAGDPRAGKHFEVLNRGDRFDLRKRKVVFRWPLGDR